MGSDRDGSSTEAGVSVFSRRHFVAGGLITIGGSSLAMEGATSGRFSDTESTTGTISAGGFPRLDYHLYDRTKNDNVSYEVAYQVENVSDFARLEVQVRNVTTDSEPSSDSFSNQEGVFDFPFGGGTLGGESSDTFQFSFEVFEEGNPDPVIEKTVSDVADSEDSIDGEFSDENSPRLDWLLVDDNSTPNDSEVVFDVYYAVSNLTEFGELEMEFQSSDGDWASQTATNANTPIGKFSHTTGNTGDSYDIVANVKNGSGLTVDSTTITDVADGNDPSPYGQPTLSDSPSLDSFTVTDVSSSDTAAFSVEYTLSNLDRLARVNVIFDNQSGNDDTDELIEDPEPPDDPITYPPDGKTYWNDGDTYHVTVEVFEEREGVTFPISSGTVSIEADGPADSKNYPADSI